MLKLLFASSIFTFLVNVSQATTVIRNTETTANLSTNSTIFYTTYPPYTYTPPSLTTTTTESTTTSTTDSTTWTTPTRPPTLAPTLPPTAINQLCCGQNEIYLRQGEAPNCDPVCMNLAEKCTKIFIQAPSGCYCLPGHCRNPHVSQGTLRPITVTSTTSKIITSFEPTTVTETVPNITETNETHPPPIATDTEPSTEISDTKPPPIGTNTEPIPSTEITEITDTKPPPIGTEIIRTPTFRTTPTPSTTPFRHSTFLPSTIQTNPPIPFPFCCGNNEFYHYNFQGVAQYCDPVCNNLTMICVDIFFPSIGKCYCLPGYCRDSYGNCVRIQKHCHLRR